MSGDLALIRHTHTHRPSIINIKFTLEFFSFLIFCYEETHHLIEQWKLNDSEENGLCLNQPRITNKSAQKREKGRRGSVISHLARTIAVALSARWVGSRNREKKKGDWWRWERTSCSRRARLKVWRHCPILSSLLSFTSGHQKCRKWQQIVG